MNIKHGQSYSKIYRIWASMRARCCLPTSRAFKDYGGRGILLSSRWQSFEFFFEDMGDVPSGMSLERLDNNGPYSKENCVWASRRAQARNRRDNFLITIDEETKCLAEWCDVYDQVYKRVYQRIKYRGWDAKKALESGRADRWPSSS